MNSVSQRLLALRDKIDTNVAQLPHYYEYENLLTQNGYTHDEVLNHIRPYGYVNWDDYYKARNRYPKDRNTEGAVLGSIIGLGLGTALRIALFKSTIK